MKEVGFKTVTVLSMYILCKFVFLMPIDVAAEMSGARLYIGRLSDVARDRDVERFFKGYGRIREIVLKNGYGFVVSILLDFA